MADTVTVSKEEWDEIQSQLHWLQCLENAGVDNWSGYDFAQDLYREEGGYDN